LPHPRPLRWWRLTAQVAFACEPRDFFFKGSDAPLERHVQADRITERGATEGARGLTDRAAEDQPDQGEH
jgi:hypothetical protein